MIRMDIYPGQKAVTGSRNYFEIHSEEVFKGLVDCGICYNDDGSNEEFHFDPKSVEAIFLTHGHADHVAALPRLFNLGARCPIYCTQSTRYFLGLQLRDGLKIQEQELKLGNLKKPLYSSEDVRLVMNSVVVVHYGNVLNIKDNVSVTFFPNKHMPGAAFVLFRAGTQWYYGSNKPAKQLNVLFTGDYNNKNVFFKDISTLPHWVRELDLYLVTESTYGKPNDFSVEPTFEKNIVKFCKEGKKIIILSQAIQKYQLIMKVLCEMIKNGLIPNEYKIYLDGKMAKSVNENWNRLEELDIDIDFKSNRFQFVYDDRRDVIASKTEKSIILTTNGMGTHGPARSYISKNIMNPKAVLHFTSYLSVDSVGRQFLQAEKGNVISVYGCDCEMKADVCITREWSSHADHKELLNFVKSFKNLKGVILVHGEADAKESFRRRIKDSLNEIDVFVPSENEIVRIKHKQGAVIVTKNN